MSKKKRIVFYACGVGISFILFVVSAVFIATHRPPIWGTAGWPNLLAFAGLGTFFLTMVIGGIRPRNLYQQGKDKQGKR